MERWNSTHLKRHQVVLRLYVVILTAKNPTSLLLIQLFWDFFFILFSLPCKKDCSSLASGFSSNNWNISKIFTTFDGVLNCNPYSCALKKCHKGNSVTHRFLQKKKQKRDGLVWYSIKKGRINGFDSCLWLSFRFQLEGNYRKAYSCLQSYSSEIPKEFFPPKVVLECIYLTRTKNLTF